MTQKLRVAVVGCGRMGAERAKAIAGAGATVAGLCDLDRNRALAVASMLGTPTTIITPDPSELSWECLDAVFVCTPPAHRGPVELRALRAGIPFFVEKPIGLSVEHCRPILHELHSTNIIAGVGYMNRYRASVRHAARVLQGHRIIGVTCYWLSRRYTVPWWDNPDESGGPINEQATHLVDLCRVLNGDIRHVHAASAAMRCQDGTSAIAAAITFQNGSSGTILYSCDANGKQIGINIYTEDGRLELRDWDFSLIFNSIDGTLVQNDESVFRKETEAFLTAVSRNDPDYLQCSYSDAVRTQAVVDALRLSASTGHSVAVE